MKRKAFGVAKLAIAGKFAAALSLCPGFTGSKQPIINSETDLANGKRLLLIKDSYAHSLVPFLANHYEKITMVDMRYINGDLNYFLDLDEYTQAMFMYNVVSFAEDETARKIMLTK